MYSCVDAIIKKKTKKIIGDFFFLLTSYALTAIHSLTHSLTHSFFLPLSDVWVMLWRRRNMRASRARYDHLRAKTFGKAMNQSPSPPHGLKSRTCIWENIFILK